MIETVIFDGDDTLWYNQIYYDRAIQALVDFMAEQGVGETQVRATMNEREMVNTKAMGYIPERFPRSMVETYCLLCSAPEWVDISTVKLIGTQALQAIPDLMPHALSVLQQVKKIGMRVILFSAGDDLIQQGKIDALGIRSYFDEIHIVPSKNTETFRTMLSVSKATLPHVVMVGNSWNSDMVPALANRVRGIFIPNGGWIYDNNHSTEIENKQVTVLQDLSELLEVLLGRSNVR